MTELPPTPPTPPENPYRRAAYELLAALDQPALRDVDAAAYRAAVADRLRRTRDRLAALDAQRDADRAALAEAFARHRSGRLRADVVTELAEELPPRRCDAYARRGTGTGACDRLLDEHGGCDRATTHLADDLP